MKKTLRYILIGCCGALLAACMVLAYINGTESRKEILCKGIITSVIDSLENSFVTSSEVKKFIDKEYGQYLDLPIDSINLTRIERIIDGRSAVKKSQAYVTRDGMLHIDVTQRKPVVRFQKSDGGFYADAEGFIFPLQHTYASHVQVIDGNIPLAANSGYKGHINSKEELKWFKDMMKVVNFVETDKVWKDKIVQIHVNADHDLVIIPREGHEYFIFGQPDRIEDKFHKMGKYYTHIIPAKGEKHYREIDLRFKGQIVCRK